MRLIKPHGGKLINRVLTGKARENARTYAAALKRIDITFDVMLDLENIATGVFSPLQGFVNEKEYHRIITEKKLCNGLAWTIPITFPVAEEPAQEFTNNEENCDIALYFEHTLKAILHLKEKFYINHKETARLVYGTEDLNHPGVKRLFESSPLLFSGEVDLIERSNPIILSFQLDPIDVRKIIQEKQWKTVVGFQTRNPPHRAHEYLQRTALEMAEGLFIQPLIGWKKKGDFKPEAIFKAYQALIAHYYPKDRVILGALTTAMRYAGPREAVFHAIIRKNFGCSHFIVGRDHAGVGKYYEKYAAHAIFDEIENLGITPLRFCGPYYCQQCEQIVTEKTCGHSPQQITEISGTKIREALKNSHPLPSHLMRPEVLSVLKEEDFIE